MKVVLIYRPRRLGGHSIEELFRTVMKELRKHVEVLEYETGSRWCVLLDAWKLRRLQADIYHVTGDINYLVLLLPWRKVVLTIHDLGHYLFKLRGLRRWIYKWLWLALPIRVAAAVTAVSNSTRDSIVRHLGLTEEQVDVIMNCFSLSFKPKARVFNTACPTILQVGTQPYKNVLRLVEALRGINCRLSLLGPLDSELEEKLKKYETKYENLLSNIIDYFNSKLRKLLKLGINDVIIDPGFGFAKTVDQNYEILKNLKYFNALKQPIMVGISRKSMVYKKLGVSSAEALNGTTVLNTIALINGVSLLRVHDVKEAVEAIKLFKATYN